MREILGKMSTAMRELNYQGLFTFEFGSALDTYQIVHRVEDGREYERLERLNGNAHEILRSGRDIACLSRGDQLLRGTVRSLSITDELLEVYRFNLLAEERIAGRQAIMVEILPRDEFRYGYYLGIDRASNLPLKAMLLGPKQTVLERFQFVRLSVGDGVEVSASRPQGAQVEKIDANAGLCEGSSREAASWRAEWLPKGFVFSGQRETRTGGDMLSYTDGLATFSVFINKPGNTTFSGGRFAQRGAMVAYTAQKNWRDQGYSVAVVGEIPIVTAQRVIENLESLP